MTHYLTIDKINIFHNKISKRLEICKKWFIVNIFRDFSYIK